jgi:hypothetical protein
MTPTSTAGPASPTTSSTPSTSSTSVFGALTGLTAVVVLLQGLWAGIFLEHDGKRDAASSWIDVHAWGAHIATALAVLTVAWAVWKLRSRTDLLVGSILLLVVIVVESYIGGLIVDKSKDTLTAVHVPLAMITMGLVVWLPLRARTGRH